MWHFQVISTKGKPRNLLSSVKKGSFIYYNFTINKGEAGYFLICEKRMAFLFLSSFKFHFMKIWHYASDIYFKESFKVTDIMITIRSINDWDRPDEKTKTYLRWYWKRKWKDRSLNITGTCRVFKTDRFTRNLGKTWENLRMLSFTMNKSLLFCKILHFIYIYSCVLNVWRWMARTAKICFTLIRSIIMYRKSTKTFFSGRRLDLLQSFSHEFCKSS